MLRCSVFVTSDDASVVASDKLPIETRNLPTEDRCVGPALGFVERWETTKTTKLSSSSHKISSVAKKSPSERRRTSSAERPRRKVLLQSTTWILTVVGSSGLLVAHPGKQRLFCSLTVNWSSSYDAFHQTFFLMGWVVVVGWCSAGAVMKTSQPVMSSPSPWWCFASTKTQRLARSALHAGKLTDAPGPSGRGARSDRHSPGSLPQSVSPHPSPSPIPTRSLDPHKFCSQRLEP